jgi:hypothetical protein
MKEEKAMNLLATDYSELDELSLVLDADDLRLVEPSHIEIEVFDA